MKVSDKMVSDSLPIVPIRDFVILGDYEYGFRGVIGPYRVLMHILVTKMHLIFNTIEVSKIIIYLIQNPVSYSD